MYICVCAAITEDEIKEMVKEGHSLKEIMLHTDAGLGCGSCLNYIKTIVENKNE